MGRNKKKFNPAAFNSYFSQVESLLRRSLGVSSTARAKDLDSIKPAPPIEVGPIRSPPANSNPIEAEANVPKFEQEGEWANWKDLKQGLEVENKLKEKVEREEEEFRQLKKKDQVVKGGEEEEEEDSVHDEL
jgi:hypothetical protein